LLLRTLIEIHHKEIIHPTTKEMAISPTVLEAFLRVEKYWHGARSMEAIVSLSRLYRCRHFGPSELPAREVVELHATSDFSEKVAEKARYHLSPADIDHIAKAIHENWKKTKEGYVYGTSRDDAANP